MVSFLKEFGRFLMQRKKYFLIPVMVVVLLVGGLIVLSSGTAVAPFVYTLF